MMVRCVMLVIWVLVGIWGSAFLGGLILGLVLPHVGAVSEYWWVLTTLVVPPIGGLVFLYLGVRQYLPGTGYGLTPKS